MRRTYGVNGSGGAEVVRSTNPIDPMSSSAGSRPGDPAVPVEPTTAVPSDAGAAVVTLHSNPMGRSPFRELAARSAGSGHVIVVSSAADERIRPTVAANLAVAFAEIDASVLLMRTAATVDHAPVADSTAEGRVDLSRLLRTTGVPLVKTLDLTQLPTAIGSGRSISDLIAEASELADVVVIEAAPVLAAHDVGVLSSLADDVLMVAEHGYTTVDNASAAAELLNRMGVRLRGVVVTQIPPRKAERSRKAVRRRQSDTLELSGQQA
jgi:Mrp family chromosome partitioning ATPase